MPGHCIELEIAAGILIDSNHNCELILRQFRQLGMAIAISDFGTGDASLTYLKRFPTDAVKIEKCFVDDLGKPGGDSAVVRAIAAMARTPSDCVPSLAAWKAASSWNCWPRWAATKRSAIFSAAPWRPRTSRRCSKSSEAIQN